MLARLELATEATIEQYLAATADRQRARAAFARLFRDCDVLLTPVGAGSPFPDGREAGDHLGREITFRDLVMPFTTPQDLCGLPACTAPGRLRPRRHTDRNPVHSAPLGRSHGAARRPGTVRRHAGDPNATTRATHVVTNFFDIDADGPVSRLIIWMAGTNPLE